MSALDDFKAQVIPLIDQAANVIINAAVIISAAAQAQKAADDASVVAAQAEVQPHLDNLKEALAKATMIPIPPVASILVKPAA